jgi:catechol 2,3-dioxygenase-like lactoylglutathione lyase family enzyme
VAGVIEQVTISALGGDFAGAARFYDASLGALGWVRHTELVDEEEDESPVEAIAWRRTGSDLELWLVIGGAPTTGLHLRLTADSQLDVETFYAAALEAGGELFAAPRRWTPYRRGEFGATVSDPAGNLVEAVAPE